MVILKKAPLNYPPPPQKKKQKKTVTLQNENEQSEFTNTPVANDPTQFQMKDQNIFVDLQYT